MRFVDQVSVSVRAGDGGNGAVAFRREKYIEKGGPSGGDGGRGGSVILVVDPRRTTLLDFQFQSRLEAAHGQHGMGSDCNGRDAEDLVVPVPRGTLVRDVATGELLADLSTEGERFVAARGGRGGLGNINFATSTRQTPRFAQPGTAGEARALMLELKLLADVGLLGFPNAGKSTLISVVSHAKPKIADYPFTTLTPNLGVVSYKDEQSFVMADVPGLIEGASDGAGLGHQFLRHVERCRLLVHLVDMSAVVEGRDPLGDFATLNRELCKHGVGLATKPQLVVASKLDLPHAREALPAFEAALARCGIAVLPLSAATRQGVDALLDACAEVLFGEDTSGRRRAGRARLERRLVTAGEAVELLKAKPRARRAPREKPPRELATSAKAAKRAKGAVGATGRRAGKVAEGAAGRAETKRAAAANGAPGRAGTKRAGAANAAGGATGRRGGKGATTATGARAEQRRSRSKPGSRPRRGTGR